MPLDISSNAVLEKNKISSGGVWLLLVKFVYEDEDPVRICLNNEAITWDGESWLPAIFSLSGLSETKEGDIPSIPLSFVDFSGTIAPIIDQYRGAVGADVDIYVVHSDYLSEVEPWTHVSAEVVSTSMDSNHQISFQLGSNDLSNKRCPVNRYLNNTCRFAFKSTLCGYTGGVTTCDRTFATCTTLGNQTRFGGFPGVGSLGYLK